MNVELQDSLSTENSEDENTTNRAYVPCGVGVTVQVCGVTTLAPPAPGRPCSARVAAGCPPRGTLLTAGLAQQTDDGLLKVLGVVTGSDLMVGDVLLDINGEPVKGDCRPQRGRRGRAGSASAACWSIECASRALRLMLRLLCRASQRGRSQKAAGARGLSRHRACVARGDDDHGARWFLERVCDERVRNHVCVCVRVYVCVLRMRQKGRGGAHRAAASTAFQGTALSDARPALRPAHVLPRLVRFCGQRFAAVAGSSRGRRAVGRFPASCADCCSPRRRGRRCVGVAAPGAAQRRQRRLRGWGVWPGGLAGGFAGPTYIAGRVGCPGVLGRLVRS